MSYASTILAEASLQSYWKLDESSGSVVDYKGAVTGTADALVSRRVTGLISSEVSYGISVAHADGAGVGFGSNYPFTVTTNFSVECWININGHNDDNFIANKWGGGGTGGWVLDYYTSGTRFRRFDSGGVSDDCVGAAMTVGNVYHLVATYDGSNIRLYINNGSPTVTASTRSVAANGNALALGKYGGGGSGVSGTLDEFAIYNAALSATKVGEHYNAAYVASGGSGASRMLLTGVG